MGSRWDIFAEELVKSGHPEKNNPLMIRFLLAAYCKQKALLSSVASKQVAKVIRPIPEYIHSQPSRTPKRVIHVSLTPELLYRIDERLARLNERPETKPKINRSMEIERLLQICESSNIA